MTHVSLPSSPLPAKPAGGAGAVTFRLEHLRHVLEHSAHFLPAQGPITVFVHHNTLHAFEELPFHEAVKNGGRIFGCQPYLSEDRYRQELAGGRIRPDDLLAVLQDELGPAGQERILNFGTRLELRLAMLQYPIRLASAAELRWFILETDALRRYRPDAPPAVRVRFLKETRHWVMRDVRRLQPGDAGQPRAGKEGRQERRDDSANACGSYALAGLFKHFAETSIERWSLATWEAFALQALWRFCRAGVHDLPHVAGRTPNPVQRHRDLVLQATGEDIDLLVDDVLIRFCAAFLDQGFSDWHLPRREEGFYRSFCELYRQKAGPPDRWLSGLAQELTRVEQTHSGPLESILESLDLLGVPEAGWEEYLTATLLALRGWAGMIRQMEIRADRAARPAPPGSLAGYLAIRLILERLALAHLASEGCQPPEFPKTPGADAPGSPSQQQHAFLVFQLAQVLGWTPADLHRLSKQDWVRLVGEIEAFGPLNRRRVFHEAYERRYRTQTLDAIASHARSQGVPGRVPQSALPGALLHR